MGRRDAKSAEERMEERVKLVGQELAMALPDNDDPWWTQHHLRRLNAILLICCLSAATVGYDGAMMNALQISPTWKSFYSFPTKARLGAINAMMPAGKICGFLFVAPFSNRYGRKVALVLAFTIAVVGAGIQAGAVNFGMLVFSRWLLGFGAGVMSQPSPILLAELSYPTHRGKITALYHCFYFVGSIAAAWITFGTLKMSGDWSWRIPTLFQGAAPLLQLCFSYYLPESPRYLVAKGHVDVARELLIKHHANGDRDSLLVKHELAQIQDALRTETTSERTSLQYILSSPANRRRILISAMVGVAAQWSGNSVVSYYLTLVLDGVGITNATHQSLINGGLQIFNFIVSMSCGAMLVDRLGRRFLFLWSAAGMAIAYTIWTILNARFEVTEAMSLGYAVIPMLFVFYFHYDIALTPLLYSYPTEIFPYELRSWGVAFTLICTNASLIVGQLANPVAMASIGWRYYILFCCLNVVFLTVVWFIFPETKGKSLEEIASVFEEVPGANLVDPEKLAGDDSACHDEKARESKF
ncbi:general substrate transporter [Dactylonectria macrodidyma]|uniref:General substrate transporter n=1 Tax=Dactylonectria macrodidyma TaxID=307937 RepID=A0A9P9E5W9_9HYPO|nr:general substrate transporter [Dactylonectria macrodidyma]